MTTHGQDHPGQTSAMALETHISVLVFIADRVYKLKKPVKFGFVDFTDREVRERACHREVELNRRISPDVYLGVADVSGPDGVMADHLVVMKRMPPNRRLATLVEQRDPGVPDELRRLARLIVSFHETADTGADIDSAATSDAVMRVWEQGFSEVEPFVGTILDPPTEHRVESLVREYLAGRAPLFARRIADGWIRDGHGDLQAADMFCLADGPRVLDCLEFDDRLRHGDVASDIAFLAMDLERLGDRAAADSFVEACMEFSGDAPPVSLRHHYVAQRAHIRAKVAALRAAQSPVGSSEYAKAADEASSLLDLALGHLEAARVRLLVVGGAPGTGKSTLARGLGEALGMTVVRSDEIRKQLSGLDPITRVSEGIGEGLYSPEATDATYGSVIETARSLLEMGTSVVLDASFTSDLHRRAARDLAEQTHSEILELRCEVAPDVAAERITGRLARGDDASDATPQIAAALAAVADPWPQAVVIPTRGAPEVSLGLALAALD